MISGAIPHYLHSEPIKPVKGQAAICDWISNMGFAFDKIKVYDTLSSRNKLINENFVSSKNTCKLLYSIFIIDFSAQQQSSYLFLFRYQSKYL